MASFRLNTLIISISTVKPPRYVYLLHLWFVTGTNTLESNPKRGTSSPSVLCYGSNTPWRFPKRSVPIFSCTTSCLLAKTWLTGRLTECGGGGGILVCTQSLEYWLRLPAGPAHIDYFCHHIHSVLSFLTVCNSRFTFPYLLSLTVYRRTDTVQWRSA